MRRQRPARPARLQPRLRELLRRPRRDPDRGPQRPLARSSPTRSWRAAIVDWDDAVGGWSPSTAPRWPSTSTSPPGRRSSPASTAPSPEFTAIWERHDVQGVEEPHEARDAPDGRSPVARLHEPLARPAPRHPHRRRSRPRTSGPAGGSRRSTRSSTAGTDDAARQRDDRGAARRVRRAPRAGGRGLLRIARLPAAAELIRGTPAPVADLVRTGRVRELRGIGPGIERAPAGARRDRRDRGAPRAGANRLRGARRARPAARIGAERATQIGRALGIHTAEEFRAAAAAGRLREAPGVGPKTEARLLAALERGLTGSARPLLLTRARATVERIAEAVGGEPAGDPRRWRDASTRLAVAVAVDDPAAVRARFADLPEIVALLSPDPSASPSTAPPSSSSSPRPRRSARRSSCHGVAGVGRGAGAAARRTRRGRRLRGSGAPVRAAGAPRGAALARPAPTAGRGRRDPR